MFEAITEDRVGLALLGTLVFICLIMLFPILSAVRRRKLSQANPKSRERHYPYDHTDLHGGNNDAHDALLVRWRERRAGSVRELSATRRAVLLQATWFAVGVLAGVVGLTIWRGELGTSLVAVLPGGPGLSEDTRIAGVPLDDASTIETNGDYALSLDGSQYHIDGPGIGVGLTTEGAPVGPGYQAGWNAVQVERSGAGFNVLWKHTNGSYSLWSLDSAGARQSHVYTPAAAVSPALVARYETIFAADLDGNRSVGRLEPTRLDYRNK
jgi:hypothetical protein